MAYPTRRRGFCVRPTLILLALVGGVTLSVGALANPIGPSGMQGISGIQGLGTPEVIINQTDARATINWQQFNIASSEVTRFIQPSAASLALNRIFDQNPSQILGSLQANGSVILLNPNGVMFGPGSQVNVSGLIASSLNLSDENFLNGRYLFEGLATNGAVKNAGTIETHTGGFVYLLAPNVENSGVIRSSEGHITLAAGTTAYLSDRPDGRGFLVEVTAPSGEALNLSRLIADGGQINLYGRIVNQEGLIQANSVRERSGRIELFASEQLNLANGSQTVARGGEPVSDGGTVIALSDKTAGRTRFDRGAILDVSGGTAGGNGGFVELSGKYIDLGGRVRADTTAGYRGGRLLIDPDYFTVDADFLSGYIGSGVSDIRVEATNDITVDSSIFDFAAWELAPGDEGTLSFDAGHDLRFDNVFWFNSSEEGFGNRWNLGAIAGNDIVLTGSKLWTGAGQSLATERGGNIDFEAGQDIKLVQPGSSHSALWAGANSDIRLSAGRDLIAPSTFEAGLGLYSGIRLDGPGDLIITTRRDVLGDMVGGVPVGPGFLLSNGTATVTVGGRFGTAESYANLTLGTGHVTVDATEDIYLGVVQDKGLVEGANRAVTADPDNRVAFQSAEGDIHLRPFSNTGSALDDFSRYYPASFRATAPRGNILVESHLSFWPSPTGSVELAAGQDLRGVPGPSTGGSVANIELFHADLQRVIGLAEPTAIRTALLTPAENVPEHQAAPVTFSTESGDIAGFIFNLRSPSYRKQVTIASGRDLKQFVARISVPDGGSATVEAARDIDMSRVSAAALGDNSGVHFHGSGTGRVRAGGVLDLANSQGIQHRSRLNPSADRDAGGVLDIAVGGNLEMTRSRIVTHNGAGISIHGLDGTESPVGGRINVGTNAQSFGSDTGILTKRGGSIDIRATGDVDVNLSRVGTLGGGDIRITSTAGDINAGSGEANETVVLDLTDSIELDDGTKVEVPFRVQVPGSGIFTFHPDDPDPLPAFPEPPAPVFPEFVPVLPLLPVPNPVLVAEITKHAFLGHDTAALQAAIDAEFEGAIRDYEARATEMIEAQFQEYLESDEVAAAVAVAEQEFEVIRANHIADWKLGNIALDAGQDVVVPKGGIRGRRVSIKAKGNLDLQGGQIQGDTDIDANRIIGNIKDLTGPVKLLRDELGVSGLGANLITPPTFSVPTVTTSGSSSLGGLSGATGSVSTTVSAATTVAEAVDAGQEQATPDVVAEAETVSESGDGGEDKKGKKTRSVRLKRGVTIEVEVTSEKPL